MEACCIWSVVCVSCGMKFEEGLREGEEVFCSCLLVDRSWQEQAALAGQQDVIGTRVKTRKQSRDKDI